MRRAYRHSQLSSVKLQYEKDFLAQWKAAGIDAIVMPVVPWVNYTPKTWVRSKQWLGYSALWNLLNYTALTIPGSHADAKLDQPGADWKNHVPRNDSDKFNHEQCEYFGCVSAIEFSDDCIDDIDLVNGMPVGLQIVSGRFGEEKAVAISKVVESLK